MDDAASIPAAATDLPGFPLVGGNRVTIYSNGCAAFRDMRAAIESARERVRLGTYTFRDDAVGHSFADLLAEGARSGKAVHVIYDSVGSIETPDAFFEALAATGVRVLEFHPFAPWKPRFRWHLNRRDHRKILTVDGRTGFVGGLNLGEEYAGEDNSAAHWRDTHARIVGPAVAVLDRIFEHQWRHHRRRAPRFAPAPAPAEAAGDVPVRFFAIGPVPGQRIARRVFLRALRGARRSIHMTYGYFVPERAILRALRRAAKSGVDVRIVAARMTDSHVVRLAGQSTWSRLLRAGVRIHELLGQPLHAKTLVVDGEWTILGSANMDARSFLLNYEVGVELFGAGPGGEMEAMFAADLARSEEVRRETWRRRPWWLKVVSKLCRVLRPFL